jgi:exodeoxyribonuclease III
MTIATYNVNGVNGRLPVLLRWLELKKPDVVCLQELKSPEEKIPREAVEAAGYKGVWHGQKSWNGVAILSRTHQVTEVGRILPGDTEDVQSRYIECMVNGVRVVCIYLPNGNPAPGPKFDYKMGWFARLQKRAGELIAMDGPTVITGDFNVMPTEIDVYKPERWVEDALFRPEVRAAFKQLLDVGWTDAIRTLYPDKVVYTFFDYFRNAFQRNAGLRIDHFLLNPALKPKLRNGGVDLEVRGWEKTSDHAPVWIDLAI